MNIPRTYTDEEAEQMFGMILQDCPAVRHSDTHIEVGLSELFDVTRCADKSYTVAQAIASLGRRGVVAAHPSSNHHILILDNWRAHL